MVRAPLLGCAPTPVVMRPGITTYFIFAVLTTVDFRITGLLYDLLILLYPRSATAIIVLLEFTAVLFGS